VWNYPPSVRHPCVEEKIMTGAIIVLIGVLICGLFAGACIDVLLELDALDGVD
jgi:hypothetical protein